MFNTASRISTALLPAFFMVLSSCMSPGTGESTQPESGYKSLEPTGASTADTYMIAAANPDAVAAGQEIMRRGGSAVDAMVTVQLVLNIVEPESSGIGGGAFLVYYDQDNDMVTALDGRETAPAKVDERLFFQPLAEFGFCAGRDVWAQLEQCRDRSLCGCGSIQLRVGHRAE